MNSRVCKVSLMGISASSDETTNTGPGSTKMTNRLYTLEIANKGDQQDIDNYVNEHFYTDLPMFFVFGFDEWPNISTDKKKPESDEHVAFVVKAVSADNNIVGVAINRIKPPPPIKENTDQRLVQIYKFLEFTKEDSKILSLPERTVELYILSVASDWRHKGIAKSLSEESVRIAKEQGFEMMKVVCVNQFTIMAVQSLGFQEFYTLRYSDYSKRSGNDVTLREFPPHDCLSIYVKDLRT